MAANKIALRAFTGVVENLEPNVGDLFRVFGKKKVEPWPKRFCHGGSFDSETEVEYVDPRKFLNAWGRIISESIEKSRKRQLAAPRGPMKYELLHLDRVVTENKVREIMGRRLRPATLPELLAFAEGNPKFVPDFPIVALASIFISHGWDDRMYFGHPCIRAGRIFDGHFDGDVQSKFWPEETRFLAVAA